MQAVKKIAPKEVGPKKRWTNTPEGKVTGLRARGGFEVDIVWRDGKVTDYRIRSQQPRQVTVRVNGETKTVQPQGLSGKRAG